MDEIETPKKKNWFVIFVFVILTMAIMVLLFRPYNNGVEPAPVQTIVQQPSPTQPATVPVGTITFCFRLDGREDGHLPALMGSAATDTYPNGLSGSNWSLPATATGTEQYGILPDGTIFAKVAFLQQYGMVSSCQLKADRTSWQPEEGTKEKINGEDAMVWK